MKDYKECGFKNEYGKPCDKNCKYYETCSRRDRSDE